MDWDVLDLGRMGYAQALAVQRDRNLAVSRGEARPALLLVEHDPVITVSHRQGVRDHILASPEVLEKLGIEVQDTDRGGDVTYHGPGQLVAYPILRLADHGLNLGKYMRLLEQAVIDTVAGFGVAGHTERGATGVWVELPPLAPGSAGGRVGDAPRQSRGLTGGATAKLCAMGVRIRKNTTMHGLALNVTTDLTHFQTIDPCGLGRPVTSLRQLLGEACPSMDGVKQSLAQHLVDAVDASRRAAESRQPAHENPTP